MAMVDEHFYPAMDPVPMVPMWTPINGTHELTFGFTSKQVMAICQKQSTFKPVQILLVQLSIACFITSSMKAILRPVIRSSVFGQILGGVLAGPSILSRNFYVRNTIFPYRGLHLLDTISTFGCVFFLFLIGMKMDITLVAKSGKKALVIGVMTFLMPVLITVLSSIALKSALLANTAEPLTIVGLLHACTTFHGIACFLGDLKILNSEVGRLAISCSLISGSISYTVIIISFIAKHLQRDAASIRSFYVTTFCVFAQFVFIKHGMKRLFLWMIRKTPRGQPIKEVYVTCTVWLLLFCAFVGELFGQHTYFGPIILGIALPAGSVLAATLTDKLEGFVSLVLLPLYFLSCGGKTDLTSLDVRTTVACVLLALIGALTKFLAATVPCILFFNMHYKDATILGLILSTVGILDIQFYSRANQLGLIDAHCFSVMNISSVVVTGFISVMVQVLYDPSSRYISRKRQAIQDASPNGEFRVLACIHNQEQVPGIIDLLRVSNPTKQSPLGIYVIHLRELVGGVAPLLMSLDSIPSLPSEDSIAKAFLIFQRSNEMIVSVQPFMAIAPVATMHNDICTLALDRGICLILLPFHRQWDADGYVENAPRCRQINWKVLSKAPCSVGILIDRRGPEAAALAVIGGAVSTRRIGVFFTGGPDDREAVAYATRIAKQQGVMVTVVRFVPSMENIEDDEEKNMDEQVISEFKLCGAGHKRTAYNEEHVVDSGGICNVVRSMQNSFDLIIVGRRSEKSALDEWCEFPELGFIGDFIASKDFDRNVLALVIQQHRYALKDTKELGTSSRFSDNINDLH